jgi:hypothetical protein
MKRHRLNRVSIITITLLSFAGAAFAGNLTKVTNLSNPLAGKKITQTQANTAVATLDASDIEIITDLEGNHFWQLAVTNTSTKNAANIKAYVTFEGYRKQDKVQTVGAIPTLGAGKTGLIRERLPSFKGMHKMRIKVGGTDKTVTIPPPFNRDEDALSQLQIKKIWAHKVDGKIRWYLETEPNLYDTIPANSASFLVTFRERTKKYCHEENFSNRTISYLAPGTQFVKNLDEIRPGQSVILFGDLDAATARPRVPKNVDRLTIQLQGGSVKQIQLDRRFHSENIKECP